jgi:hypothetical protein
MVDFISRHACRTVTSPPSAILAKIEKTKSLNAVPWHSQVKWVLRERHSRGKKKSIRMVRRKGQQALSKVNKALSNSYLIDTIKLINALNSNASKEPL